MIPPDCVCVSRYISPPSSLNIPSLSPLDACAHGVCLFQIQFVLLMSRQGKVRLSKWYTPRSTKEKQKTHRELSNMILARQQKLCNFLEWKDVKVIYKR